MFKKYIKKRNIQKSEREIFLECKAEDKRIYGN